MYNRKSEENGGNNGYMNERALNSVKERERGGAAFEVGFFQTHLIQTQFEACINEAVPIPYMPSKGRRDAASRERGDADYRAINPLEMGRPAERARHGGTRGSRLSAYGASFRLSPGPPCARRIWSGHPAERGLMAT